MHKKHRHKVLVADENLSCQLLMRVLMKKANLEAKIVGNGAAVIEAVMSEQFDMIIMNTNLPEISGIAVADAIRKKGIKIPIIALLSSGRNADIKKCLKVSFDGYLQKPITKKPLYEMLSRFLTETESNRPNQKQVERNYSNDDNAASYIDRFFEDIPEVLDQLDDLNKNVDLEMIAELVHELREPDNSDGLESLQEYADELEKLIDQVNMDGAHEAADEIYSICMRLINQ